MRLPDQSAAMAALRHTWPPEVRQTHGPFEFQHAHGAGKRVNAASAIQPIGADDIAWAEARFADAGRDPLFVLQPGQADFDAALAARGYGLVDPTVLLARRTHRADCLATQGDGQITAVLAAGGMGPQRQAVMARVRAPKTFLIDRVPDRPRGVAFVARHADGAMLHGLYVVEDARRAGIGCAMVDAALGWSHGAGAGWLALAVVEANAPASALYASLGFQPVGRYWYRTRRG
ncbi:MAG: GNAT family N-acetyltransferase [Pseudomonadota bacterium]